MVMTSSALAEEELPTLDNLSLFMSPVERDQIDKDSIPVQAPEKKSIALPETEKPVVNKPITKKVTLHGAVVRPDHSAVLMLNTGTRIIRYRESQPAPDFHFEVKAFSQSVKLSPGESVQIRVGDE